MDKKLVLVLVLVFSNVSAYSEDNSNNITSILKEEITTGLEYEPEYYLIPEQQKINDPFESINRPLYSFNKSIDNSLIKPITITYQNITPNIFQIGVTNFINYIKQPVNIVYFALQGNKQKTGDSMGRFLLNTFGFGVLDFASQAEIPLHETNFGDTLGVWGVGEGPYVVLPIIGGGTLRDNVSRVTVDVPISLENNFNIPEKNTTTIIKVIETRKQLLPMDKTIEEGALDEYSFVRNAIVQSKRNTIENLKQPELK